MEKETRDDSCCSCGEDFKKDVKEIVDRVEGYSKADHDKKKKEIDAAFKKEEK